MKLEISVRQTLEEILEDENCSLLTLARNIGISDRVLGKIMHGGQLSMESAVKIANYYHCSLGYLFSLTDYNRPPKKQLEVDRAGFYDRYRTFLAENKVSHYRLCKEIGISTKGCWKGRFPLTSTIVLSAKHSGESIEYFVCKK